MTKQEYRRDREKMARKARVEFLGMMTTSKRVVTQSQLQRTMRAINYMVKNMGFNTVISEQMPNWILKHMYYFAEKEARLMARKLGSKNDAPSVYELGGDAGR